ncbi:MAG: SusC/RagA family TonB-linked outer membrane protein [Mucilaginibacter sp.]|nr:SusC/RagA family TonB-linked outer membrane protein [Mucilaginibacter sp.]
MHLKNLLKVFFSLILFCFANEAMAQRRAVTGTVADENNALLPGVTITNEASKVSTVSVVNGKFIIQAAANETITFSFLGYNKLSQVAGDATTLTIKLVPSPRAMNEVVVVGYGTQDRDKVTSAVDHVTTKDFRQSGARNPLDLIQGKVAGLNLTRTSGSNPNSGVAVQLRGAVTVTGSSSPLYVVDGIPYPNANILDVLQQDDIESIDVLKDGSGAAIYGTTANAGVILVTTKKGRDGAPRVDYSSYFRKEYVQRRPDFLNANEYRQRIASGDINQEDFGSSTDFYDQLINHDNLSQNHNLSVSGGTNKTTYRASINYRNLEGIAKENGREEYSMRLNLNQTALQDRLKMQFNLASNFNNANLLGGGGWESELTKNPTLSNYNADGTYRFDLTSTNEYARLFQETNRRKQQTTTASGRADLTIIDGLKASVFGSVVRDSYTDGQYKLKASEASMEDTDFPGGGYAYRGTSLFQDFAFEPTIQYDKTFAQKHAFTALIGYSYRYHIEEGHSADNRGFINDLFHEDALQEGAALGVGKANINSFKNDNTLIALFTRLNYAYDDKYLAQFILRREGSSRFGDNHKFGYFPAASLGWVISKENFMQSLSAINFLKLRLGYGVTGNSGFENNASRVTLGGGGKYLFPDGQYLETYGPNRNPNPDLKWETKRELNIGLDFTLLNNRLSGKLDLFKRTTKDLLDTYTSPQPPFIQSSIYTNVGSISSKGIELGLSYKAVKSGDFSWNTDATFSTLKNTLDSYSNDQYKVLYKTFGDIGGAGALGNAITTYEGGELGEFWGKRFAGFTADGKWLFYNRNGEKVTNDQINISKDRNLTDLAKIGNAIPKFYASWGNDFHYKNFDLRVFLRGKFDFDILNTTALSYANKTWSGNLLKSTFSKYNQINDTYQYSNYYLESGTYVKLDEVTLSYTFRLKTKWINNLRVYFTGQNLATITGYTGGDPDFVLDTGTGPGIDSRGAYPSTRTFLLGLNVGF